MTRRVVVSGLGVIAPNGNGIADFELALRKGESGIRYQQIMEEAKFACRVAGVPRGVDELAAATFDEDELLAELEELEAEGKRPRPVGGAGLRLGMTTKDVVMPGCPYSSTVFRK